MPDISVAGVRASDQGNATDEARGIDHAVVQDASGRLYDVHASDTDAGRKRLHGRTRAAQALQRAKEPAALGFAVDQVLASSEGDNPQGPTGTTAVMISPHREGTARPLDLLTLDDCASIGTAIGAIHRLNPAFIQREHYPVYATGQIRAQLVAWIKRLRQAGHIPPEITSSWTAVLDTDGLWSFSTCLVHGGFHDGDVLFSGSTITAVTNWQDMQVNDPARDLAWIFSKLDESHRNAVLSAYGRMLGSRLDDLIMLRANLWLQMEQVGEFIQALADADSQKIIQFKAQVERLAHQLSLATDSRSTAASMHRSGTKPPSTITVGTLLDAGERRDAQIREEQRHRDTTGGDDDDTNAGVGDQTNETDRTGSAQIAQAAPATQAAQHDAAGERDVAPADDSTASRPVQAHTGGHGNEPTIAIKPPSFSIRGIRLGNAHTSAGTADSMRSASIADATASTDARDDTRSDAIAATADHAGRAQGQDGRPLPRTAQSAQFPVQQVGATAGRAMHGAMNDAGRMQTYIEAQVRVKAEGQDEAEAFQDSAAETIAFRATDGMAGHDDGAGTEHAPETILIPLLEREEQAMRDARRNLEASVQHADDAQDRPADDSGNHTDQTDQTDRGDRTDGASPDAQGGPGPQTGSGEHTADDADSSTDSDADSGAADHAGHSADTTPKA
ncbi:phosphotransferase [Bifidobacterium thermophilum]|uniref:phosphotransferase n=1 Tax=Bifidobacterium thermophilum TaxID=33905 RepID=UPI003BB5684B